METLRIKVMEEVNAENDRIAAENRRRMNDAGVLAVNVMGAPGAGKTSTIVQIIKRLGEKKCAVIEGDIESDLDTKTLTGLGIQTIQINTGGACHLDATAIEQVLPLITLESGGVLFIENVGNLVCPAEFEIGEDLKLLICSAAEGSDKPYKYPLAFEKAGLILLNKADLKPYVGFEVEFFLRGVRGLNREVPVFEVNARSGEGFDVVAKWLAGRKKGTSA
jgi:hydrogenase nickel incorporation protein HypB